MFPVYLKTKDSQPPDSSPYYTIARNGIFLTKSNWWVEVTVPVKQIAILEKQETEVNLKIPSIDALSFGKAWRFFQAIYKKHHSEGAVLLHYSTLHGWALSIPVQTVSFGHVSYAMTDRIPGYNLFGTIHSHSSMSASHSQIDVDDEAHFDGIHITIGDVDEKERFSLDAEIVINAVRCKLPLSFLTGVEELSSFQVSSLLGSFLKRERFSLTCPELADWEVPEEWVARVTKQKYFEISESSLYYLEKRDYEIK